ncbi:MAG: hypothetical protein QM235_03300 [Pseudomonadota bacterium]|nr:hypothetical protein [Pseudomonadota bacterium]
MAVVRRQETGESWKVGRLAKHLHNYTSTLLKIHIEPSKQRVG